MSFRIDPTRSFVEEIKHTGRELIDDAIALLKDQPDGTDRAVHDARKKFKRIRALYRFLEREAPDFRKTENARFRDTARSLSAARDAAALVETIIYLQDFARSDAEREALATAHDVLSRRRDAATHEDGDLPKRIEAAIQSCEDGRDALSALSLSHGEKTALKMIRKTWEKQRRKALDALGLCHEQAMMSIFTTCAKAVRSTGCIWRCYKSSGRPPCAPRGRTPSNWSNFSATNTTFPYSPPSPTANPTASQAAKRLPCCSTPSSTDSRHCAKKA